MSSARWFRVAVASLCAALPIGAQGHTLTEAWRWVRFGVADGLPAKRIHRIVETHGTVWIATAAGLARYDGQRFHRISRGDGLPTSRVDRIEPDGTGGVFVVMNDALFHGTHHGFSRISAGSRLEISDLAVLSPTRVVIRGRHEADVALFRVDRTTQRMQRLDLPAPLAPSAGRCLWTTSPGICFVNTTRGLWRYDGSKWRQALDDDRSNRRVWSVVGKNTDRDAVWLLIRDQNDASVWEWSPTGGARRVRRDGSLPMSMACAADGRLVLLHPTGDVRMLENGQWSDLITLPEMSEMPSAIRFRPNGDLWIGTDGGLFLHRRTSRRWRQIADPAPDVRNHVLALMIAKDGALWKGTPGGVHVVHADGSRTWLETIDGQPIRNVTALAQDREGTIWIGSGTGFTGVYRFDGETWAREAGSAIVDCYVHRIDTDRRGRAWFCTIRTKQEPGGCGPGVFVHEEGTLRLVTPNTDLPPARTYCAAEGRDGAMWFGTSRGVRRLHKGVWTQWTKTDGLLAKIVCSLDIDRSGQPWFCHPTGGIGTILADGRVAFPTAAAPARQLPLWDLEFDAEDTLWITTSEGVASIRDGVWTRYSHRSPARGVRTWSLTTHGGQVWFGTIGKGVLRLDPRERAGQPPLVVAGQPIIEENKMHVAWRAHAAWGDIDSTQIETRWRLDGGDWSAWSRDRDLLLDELSAGDHELQLEAKGYFGEVAPAGTSVAFTTLPCWYAQPRFYVPVGALSLVLFALSGLYFLRQRRHAALRRAFDEHVKHSEKMEAIGRLAGGVAHDFNNLLTTLLGNAELMRVQLHTYDDEELEECLDEIEAAGQRAAAMTRELVTLGRSPCQDAGNCQPDQVLAEMQPALRRLIRQDIEVHLSLAAQESRVGMGRSDFERIVMNLVVNACHAMPDRGTLTLETSTNKGSSAGGIEGLAFELRVTDTGCGFDDQTRRRIFDPFFTTKPVGEGSGLGLTAVHGLVQRAGGRVDVRSELEAGSTFTVTLPDRRLAQTRPSRGERATSADPRARAGGGAP